MSEAPVVTTEAERRAELLDELEPFLLRTEWEWRLAGMPDADIFDGLQNVRDEYLDSDGHKHPGWIARRWRFQWRRGQRLGNRRLLTFSEAGLNANPYSGTAEDDLGSKLDGAEHNDRLRQRRSPIPESWQSADVFDQVRRHGQAICPRCSGETDILMGTTCEGFGQCHLVYCPHCHTSFFHPCRQRAPGGKTGRALFLFGHSMFIGDQKNDTRNTPIPNRRDCGKV